MSTLFSFGNVTIHNYVNVAKLDVLTVMMYFHVLRKGYKDF